MRKNMIRRLWAGFAVALGCMENAAASNWCPPAGESYVSCSNCTRTLTCSVSNGTITLLGSNVTLDGNGHSLWSPASVGVRVNGTNTTIKNLTVHMPRFWGVYNFTSQASLNLYNVHMDFSGGYGVGHVNAGSLSVSGSSFYGNSSAGITSSGNAGPVGTFLSTFQSNKGDGAWFDSDIDSYHTDNTIAYNKRDGFILRGFDRGMNGYNYYYANTQAGLRMATDARHRIFGNAGWASGEDCNGIWADYLDVNSNSWTINNGCIQK